MATRQIPPSSNPFAVGAVVLDSAPYTDYFLRQEAEKRAKQEAYDKYFQDLEGTLSPTGMDTKLDLPVLDEMKKQWRDFTMQNREAIRKRNDGGKAYMKGMEMFNDMKSLIEKSKQKISQLKDFNEYRMKYPDAIIGDEFIQEVDKLRQPVKVKMPIAMGGKVYQMPNMFVDNPAYGTVDYTKFQPVTPLKPDELRAMRKGYGANMKPGSNIERVTASKRDPLMDVITTEKAYSPEQLKTISMAAALDYDANRRIRATAHQFEPSPEEMAVLTEAFRYVHGPEAKIKDKRDLFAAQAIVDNIAPQVEEKEVKNESRAAAAQEAKERRMAQYRQSLSDRGAAYRKALESGEADNWLEGQMQYLEGNPTATYTYTPSGSDQKIPVKVMGVEAPIRKRLAVDNIEPDVVVQLPDGNFQGMFYAREFDGKTLKKKDGKFVIDQNITPITLTRGQMKTAIGDVYASGKLLTSQLGGGQGRPAAPAQNSKPSGGGSWKDRAKRVKQ